MSDLDKSLSRLAAQYAAAVLAKDAGAFIRLYDPKVRVFDTWGLWSYEGAEAWQRAVEAWFGSLGSERVRVSFEGLQVVGEAQAAVASAFVRYEGLSAEGAPLRAMHNRLTWGLRTTGHVLRIVHEHSSAPIGFEDMKAILQRPASG